MDGAGANTASGNLGLRKRGTGTLTLTGASTLSDQLNIESGRVFLTGSIIPGNHITNGGDVRIGANNTPGITNGILDVEGGTLQAPRTTLPASRWVEIMVLIRPLGHCVSGRVAQ